MTSRFRRQNLNEYSLTKQIQKLDDSPEAKAEQEQLRKHERFHLYCKAEKRNTTEGVVLWEIGNDE